MKSGVFVGMLVGLFLAAQPAVFGQSVQNLGLPTPAASEVVFPHLFFGRTSAGNVVSELIIVNSSNETVYVEVDLFTPRGSRPFVHYQSDPYTPNTFQGMSRFSVAPRSLHVGRYPGPNTGNLLDLGLSGWAMVRSNLPVSVYQVIKALDPETGEVASELRLMGNSQPVVRADFSVRLLTGSPPRNTGISLVNPSGSRALKLTLRLIDHRKEIIRERKVELKAMSQESFVGTDFLRSATLPGSSE